MRSRSRCLEPPCLKPQLPSRDGSLKYVTCARSSFHFSVHPDTDGPAVGQDFWGLSGRHGIFYGCEVLAASEPANNSGHIAFASARHCQHMRRHCSPAIVSKHGIGQLASLGSACREHFTSSASQAQGISEDPDLVSVLLTFNEPVKDRFSKVCLV